MPSSIQSRDKQFRLRTKSHWRQLSDVNAGDLSTVSKIMNGEKSDIYAFKHDPMTQCKRLVKAKVKVYG